MPRTRPPYAAAAATQPSAHRRDFVTHRGQVASIADTRVSKVRHASLYMLALVLLPTLVHAEPLALRAEAVAAFPAEEARQGAAVDFEAFYAIVNSAIGRYDRRTGERLASWSLPRSGPIRHINSCHVALDRAVLLCANSNFPETPMASSIEAFDARTLEHLASRSLGLTDGSLVWFDRFDRTGLETQWIAGFAHYDGRGGMPGRDHRATRIELLDASFRSVGGWMLPDSVLERLAPHSASGGAMGPDGLLYLLGHDREELYVLAFPELGPELEHVATVAVELQGQALAWDRTTSERIVWGISRPEQEVRAFRIPEIPQD